MIIEAITVITFGLITLLMSPIPPIPATPQAIIDGGDFVTTTIASGIGFLQVLYTPVLLTAIVLCITTIMLFDQIYWAVLWVLKKVPYINIK